MKRRNITLIGLRTRLDRARWVAVLGTTSLVGVWEAAQRLLLPELGWLNAVATIGLSFLLANAVAISVVQIIQTLQARIERQNRDLAALNAVIQTANRSLDLDVVMKGVLEEVSKATGMEVGLLWLRGPSKEESSKLGHRGLSPTFAWALHKEDLLERLYQAGPRLGRPLLIQHQKPEDASLAPALDQAQGPRTLAIFPILSKALVLGMLGVGTDQERAPSAEEKSLLSAIGQQIGPAVENAWLYQTSREREQKLGVLTRAVGAISAALDLSMLLEVIVREAAKVFAVPAACLLLLEEDTDSFKVAAQTGLPEEYARSQRIARDKVIPQIKAWSQPTTLPDLPVPDEMQDKGLSLFMSIPIASGGKPLGILNLYRPGTRQEYLTEEIEWAHFFANQVSVAIENARLHQGLKELNLGILRALASTVELMDPYAAGHSERVAELVVQLGERLDFPPPDLQDLHIAALLHDIGKIGIPPHILNKPGPLTPEEWETVKTHPALGVEVVEKLKPMAGAVPIILHHQERYDGAGYPAGLKGDGIPVGARILAVVAAYDAMTYPRAYRQAKSHEEAVAELRRNAGTQFDPRVVEAFEAMISARSKEQTRA